MLLMPFLTDQIALCSLEKLPKVWVRSPQVHSLRMGMTGKFPIEAVSIMAKICITSELAIDHEALFENILTLTEKPLSRAEAIASSAVKVDTNLDAALIVILTERFVFFLSA
jgi:hypothetical protein